MIRIGVPTEVITQVAEEKDIDLIIMSAHEEGHLEQFLFSYCNEKIIRRVPCSFLLVKKNRRHLVRHTESIPWTGKE